MKHSISSQIEINATPATIWKVLTDTDKYSEWNPFIKKIKGDFVEGTKISAVIGDMKFKPMLLTVNKEQELKWVGKLLVKGLFDGEHRFQIVENDNGSCTFVQSERFSGLLVGPFKKKLDTETLGGFQAMNEALKKRCEAS